MSRKALEDTRFELIKAHILEPDHSPLNPEQQEILDRVISIAKVLDKNPIQKQAVAIHQVKFPELSRSQAYEDLRLAMRLFNTIHTFDYDFWQTWTINDIVRNIERCRNNATPQAYRVIAMEHANLIKILGERPTELEDPRRTEKHSFYILVQNNNTSVKIDMNNLEKLPAGTLQELNRALFGGKEITEAEAEELFRT
ncbi:hypothetical protein SDC9_23487 [bioreactor metagenome]|uniref:Uncharacterized protein n=1 Tax=bioreactor metagenome TaxID=1076179 RepID=A0A644UFG6_9ZZZZ